MPRKPKVSTEQFITAVTKQKNAAEVLHESLPGYSSDFYVEISLSLDKKYTAQDVYRDLRENRNNRRTLILKELGLPEYESRVCKVITEDHDASADLQELDDTLFDLQKIYNETLSLG